MMNLLRRRGKSWASLGRRRSNRQIATAALAALTLTACATPSKPGRIEEPAPKAVSPLLCARIEPEPPVLGGIVQPATETERDATGLFLNGEAEARSWGRRGWERADLARREVCK